MRSLFGSHSDVHLAGNRRISAHVLMRTFNWCWLRPGQYRQGHGVLDSGRNIAADMRGIELTAEATPPSVLPQLAIEYSASISDRHIESVGFFMAAGGRTSPQPHGCLNPVPQDWHEHMHRRSYRRPCHLRPSIKHHHTTKFTSGCLHVVMTPARQTMSYDTRSVSVLWSDKLSARLLSETSVDRICAWILERFFVVDSCLQTMA